MYLHAGLVPGLDHCVDNDTICAAVGLNFWGTDDKCLSNMVSTAERVWSQTKVETLLVWAPYMPGQLCILLCAHQSISEAGATVVQTTYLDPPAWWMVITSKHFILFLICLLLLIINNLKAASWIFIVHICKIQIWTILYMCREHLGLHIFWNTDLLYTCKENTIQTLKIGKCSMYVKHSSLHNFLQF